MSESLVQMPWRSGSPHGVFGAGPVFTAAVVGAWRVVAGVWHETVPIASETTATLVAIHTTCRNRCLMSSLLRVPAQSARFVPPILADISNLALQDRQHRTASATAVGSTVFVGSVAHHDTCFRQPKLRRTVTAPL